MILSLLDPRMWAIGLGVTALSFLGGYGMGHVKATSACKERAVAQKARVETITNTVVETVAVVDKRATDALNVKISALNAQASSIQAQIRELNRAQPAPPECRLPDGLRDAINRSLDPQGAT